jgi:hypothetical protein
MNSVLERHPKDKRVEGKLEALKLVEAYLLLREGDVEAAVSLVSALQESQHLENEILKFYEEANWGSGRLSILKHKLRTSLEALSQESPSVAATIHIVCQLFDTELLSLRTETATQESLDSLRAEVGAVHEAVGKTRNEAACQMLRLEEQSERRECANQESLVRLKGELETLKEEFTETLGLVSFNRGQVHPQQALSELQLMKQEDSDTHPTCIYSYNHGTNQLYRTSLVTGETSCSELPSYTFKLGCFWSELPGQSLFITGGGNPATREVVRIDTRTYAVSQQPRMLTPRRAHAAVYHAQYFYVLGGNTGSSYLRKCERFVCAESRWEALPLLPTACISMSGVVVEGSLYALGG